ncbi:MAG TPA: hypothetical protein VNR86_05515 [Sphingomicrobium sp.]|nr:hypothetical protein [Sphingomicrobium sp.]
MMTRHPQYPAQLPICLLVLRLGVAMVMLFWTADKFVNPHHAGGVFGHFYGLEGLGSAAFVAIGSIEALIVLAFTVGLFRTFSYAAVLLMHAESTHSSWRQYAEPFDNLLFLAAWPMLAACITLFLLRRYDQFALDGRRQRRTARPSVQL